MAPRSNRQISEKLWTIVLFLLMLAVMGLAGCSRPGEKTPPGRLVLQPATALENWGIPERLRQKGEGNLYRVVSEGLSHEAALELAAGGQGEIEYFADSSQATDLAAVLKVQFLSTQGTGRIKITAFDDRGREVATVGWVFTGPLPEKSTLEQWAYRPFGANFSGCWLEERHSVDDLFRDFLRSSPNSAKTYRISVIVGQGQHALVTRLQMAPDRSRLVKIRALQTSLAANLGEEIPVELEVENLSRKTLQDVPLELVEPDGFGLLVADVRQLVDRLEPGQKKRLTWNVKAQRPHAVNMGRPWEMKLAIDGVAILPSVVNITVTDPRPGRVFYIMTEDLEAIDSAGYAVAWGNGNSWLDPQELKVQMVDKANRLNAIAEKYGAKWTHYTTWPLVKAAEWADRQSTTGRWGEVARSLQSAVKIGAAQGHEYGIHLHSDYDPQLAGNVLSYNPAVDGLWANHLRHGWAHSLSREGNPDDLASRTGMLYYYQAIMDQLSADSPNGQLLTARVGSFDFGDGEQEEALSTRAYRKAGLWGSSDANGNAGGVTASDYGQEIYFTRFGDINASARNLAERGLVEFCPTPRDYIAYDSQTAAVMNAKADEGMAVFSENGRIKPGVHAVIGFTHAMFVMGNGDWQSLEGGQFQALDEHLAYLKKRYGDEKSLYFTTATGLVREYLDYYSPVPVAVYDAKISDSFGVGEYGVSILGRDIPLTAERPQWVNLKYPLYFRHSAWRIVICKNGQPIYSTMGLPTPENEIRFAVDDRQARYTMKIYHSPYVFQMTAMVRWVRSHLNDQ